MGVGEREGERRRRMWKGVGERERVRGGENVEGGRGK